MSTDSSRPTPLGVARARFVEGLPRKAQELKGSVALLAGTPNEEKPREELRRRLHALYASAQVFQLERLATALKEAIGCLDVARDERRGLSNGDLDVLAALAGTLPVLGAEAPSSDPENVSIPRPPAVPASPRPKLEIPKPGEAKLTETGDFAKPKIPPPPPRPPTAPPPAAPPPTEGPRAARRPATLSGIGIPSIERSPSPGSTTLVGELAASIEHSGAASAPAAPTRATLRGTPVISVLVCDAAETQARVRALLAGERFEVLGAADPEEALRLSRSSAPDVVLIDKAVLARSGSDFVRRLRDDPLTDFVPVVALFGEGEELDGVQGRELGCDDVLRKPLEVEPLERALLRLAAVDAQGGTGRLSGDLTVAELAGKIADEIRRGLVESLDRGRELSVPIGDGTEVLAATWSAIGRLRAHLASRSGGRIHFREREGAAATLALVDDEPALEGAADVSLRDRRILIADDDPAVLWFFANLLKEAGAIPEEASDGEEALRLARKSRPDVIIADILMPRLDGFSLTRELKRDPVLSDVPVVLLSWKEDFLQRMRELSAGASGYLRKEAGSAQILAAVREVLRPRARLEQRLRAGGDVRGRLERIGVIPLLQTTAQHRPDARITVRDAWNLFEVDLRRPRGSNTGEETGHIVDITRTASDGSFSRGPRVVMALLGAFEGRFTVADADAPVRASVREPLDKLVERSASELGGLVDAVSGRGLLLAWRVEFDEDVLASILRSAPPTVAAVVDALRRGRGPRSLVVDGTFAPQDLERVLVDLARQGAITAVLGEGNDDRVAAARRDRGETALPVRTPSLAPPAHAAPAPSKPDDTSSVPGLDLSWAKSEEATADIVRETLKAPEEKLAAKATSKPPLAVPPPKNDDDDDEPELVVARASDPDALEEAAAEEASARPVSITVGTGRPPPPLPPEGEASDELEAQPPRSPSLADLLEPSQSSAGFVVPPDDEDDAEREPETKATAPAEEPAEKPKSEKGPEKTEEKAEKKAKPKPKPAAEPTPPAPPPKPAEPGGLGAFTWTFLLVFLAFAGFAGWRLTHPSVAPTPPPQPTPQPAPPSVPASVAPSVEPPTDTSDPSGADEAPPSSAVAPTSSGAFASYGRAADGIDPAFDIAVPAGQGLLVLQPGAEPYTIRMGQEPAVSRRVDHDPIAIAFPEGIVDLAFIRGDGTSFRFAYVESGHTRYVAPPE